MSWARRVTDVGLNKNKDNSRGRDGDDNTDIVGGYGCIGDDGEEDLCDAHSYA